MTTTTVHPLAATSNRVTPSFVVQPSPKHAIEELLLIDRGSSLPSRKKQKSTPWVCNASAKSLRITNPIQSFIEPIARNISASNQRSDRKEPISLATSDATNGSNLAPCRTALESVVKATLFRPHAAGYGNALGTHQARVAIAHHHSPSKYAAISPDDVIVTNGCSGALQLALEVLLDPGTTVLVPQPGFPQYEMIAKSLGARVLHYKLQEDKNWECDMQYLRDIMKHKSNVRAMIVNNPSCFGSVFSKHHLQDVVEFSATNQLPIVADEVYGDITFGTNVFHPISQVAAVLGRDVPVLTCSGLSKQFLLPGWRVGWLTFHDNVHESLREIKTGAKRLAQVSLGASVLTQAAVPAILNPQAPGIKAWKANLCNTLERRSNMLSRKLARCKGLTVVPTQGAMYAVVKIDTKALGLADDLDFATKLAKEENVMVLPGSSFGVRNAFRVVYSSYEETLGTAASRISSFCDRQCTRTPKQEK